MFEQIDIGGKAFDLLMLILCLCLLGGSIWADFFAPGHTHHHIYRWGWSFYFSVVVAACYFARNLLTDDVSGRWIFQRKKQK